MAKDTSKGKKSKVDTQKDQDLNKVALSEAQKASPPRATPPMAEVAKNKEEKKEGKKKDKKDQGFEVLMGIPDSEYFTFADRSLNSLFSAMLGTPGFMKGKIIEIAGKSDVGKSALARTLTAKAQAQGVKCFDVDVEKSLTSEFAQKLGINARSLMLIKPDHGEGAMRGLRHIVKNLGGQFGVLDSTSACLPEAETNDEGGGMGAQARMMSEQMKKVDKVVDKAGAIVIMISQVKMKPGTSFGNPEYVSSGGSAVGFHSRIRMTISKVEVEKDEKSAAAAFQNQETGFTVRIRITKNHTGPKRTVPFDMVVDNLFRIDLKKTAVRWAQTFKLVDITAKTVAGLPYQGRGTPKDLEAAIEGQEWLVFEAVDAMFKAREDGEPIAFDQTGDATSEALQLAFEGDDGSRELSDGLIAANDQGDGLAEIDLSSIPSEEDEEA